MVKMGSDDGSNAGPSRRSTRKGGSRGGTNGKGISDPRSDERHDNNSEDPEISQADGEVDFELYFKDIEDLKAQFSTTEKQLRKCRGFYTKHKSTIDQAIEIKKQLDEYKRENKELKVAINTIERARESNNELLDKKIAEAEEKEEELKEAKSKAEEDQKKLDEERKEFREMAEESKAAQSAKEAKQEAEFLETRDAKIAELEKLNEEKLATLAKKQIEEHEERMESLERDTKKREQEDKKTISDQKIKYEKLEKEFEEQKKKLGEVETSRNDAVRLKQWSDWETDGLKQNLKSAENEFALSAKSNEFYTNGFLQIENDIREISLRYVGELHIVDINAVHSQLEELDANFASVPISGSEVSVKLCVAHAQRIISTHLQNIFWQPFSSDITLQEPTYASFLRGVSEWLAESTSEAGTSLRAQRTYQALTLRSLQSQSNSSTKRAELFADNVMKILSLLVEDSLHVALRSDLIKLATSAASLWNLAQIDERELTVDRTLNPPSNGDEDEDEDEDRVIVMFPRVTATKYLCPWNVGSKTQIGPPGAYVENVEPESCIEKISIHDGAELLEWATLVAEGRAEEEDRICRQEEEDIERAQRRLEEELEEKKRNLKNRQEQRTSRGRRGSMSESISSLSITATEGPSSPVLISVPDLN